MFHSNEVGVQGVVNDESASGGSPFRFRGSGERVSLAGMYPLDQGGVVRNAVELSWMIGSAVTCGVEAIQ